MRLADRLAFALCVVTLFVSLPSAAVAQNFTVTGNLNAARDNHTETLLQNGMVLVVGGVSTSGTALASAELYNPATGAFTVTGSLHTARYDHTATLLANGEVLIAGGGSGNSTFASAEVYNPATGVFSVTGNMSDAQMDHTATLLENGEVLIAGGYGAAGGPIKNAELYNPASGTFTATGSMLCGRVFHTATLLGNGTVLIAGGGVQCANSAEVYNPVSGGFFPTGSMVQNRTYHSATLLNTGEVLIAGGTNGKLLSSAELYNPSNGTFTATGSMNVAREIHVATLLNVGDVLIAGGYTGSSYLSSAELYNPSTGTFTLTGSLNTPRDEPNLQRGDQTMMLGNSGLVLVAGGYDNKDLGSAELYHGPAAIIGVLYPAYKTLSIVYAAPGNRSSSGFTDTLTDGTTVTIANNFATGTSTAFTGGATFLGIGDTEGWSYGVTTTLGSSLAFTDTISDATGVSNSSPGSGPNVLNHQQDLFVLWLNPAVSLTQTGMNSVSYAVGCQTQTSGDPNPGQPEEVDTVEVFAQAMMPNSKGVTTVPLGILGPQVVNGQTLPGLANICANHVPANQCNSTNTNQCGCVPSDFAPILAQDPLLNYSSTENPLNADTSGATACTNPTSSDSCRYVPIMSSPAEQVTQLLEGPNEPGGNIPVNPFTQSDSTQTTYTLSESIAYNVAYTWNIQLMPFGTGVDLRSTDMFTVTNGESTGESNGSAHTMMVSFSSSTVGCIQHIPIFEDTVYHTFLFQQPAGNTTCP